MTTYIEKQYSTTFTNGFNPDQLIEEILTDATLSALTIDNTTPNASGLVYNETANTVTIYFTTVPNQSQLDAYNALVDSGAHVPIEKNLYTSVSEVSIKTDNVKGSNYKRIAQFSYPGSDKYGAIAKIVMSSYKDAKLTDYSIMCSYKMNNTQYTLCENTFTNGDEELVDLGTIANVPTSEAKIELWAKSSDNKKKVYIEGCTVYFS